MYLIKTFDARTPFQRMIGVIDTLVNAEDTAGYNFFSSVDDGFKLEFDDKNSPILVTPSYTERITQAIDMDALDTLHTNTSPVVIFGHLNDTTLTYETVFSNLKYYAVAPFSGKYYLMDGTARIGMSDAVCPFFTSVRYPGTNITVITLNTRILTTNSYDLPDVTDGLDLQFLKPYDGTEGFRDKIQPVCSAKYDKQFIYSPGLFTFDIMTPINNLDPAFIRDNLVITTNMLWGWATKTKINFTPITSKRINYLKITLKSAIVTALEKNGQMIVDNYLDPSDRFLFQYIVV